MLRNGIHYCRAYQFWVRRSSHWWIWLPQSSFHSHPTQHQTSSMSVCACAYGRNNDQWHSCSWTELYAKTNAVIGNLGEVPDESENNGQLFLSPLADGADNNYRIVGCGVKSVILTWQWVLTWSIIALSLSTQSNLRVPKKGRMEVEMKLIHVTQVPKSN